MEGDFGRKEFLFIRDLVFSQGCILLADNKFSLVRSKVYQLLKTSHIDSFQSYQQLLEGPDRQHFLDLLLRAVLIHHTSFFREQEHFEFLENQFIPQFLQQGYNRRLRVWSAACSTGEEACSIAMILEEWVDRNSVFNWELQASDLCVSLIESARQGKFPLTAKRTIPPELLVRYFSSTSKEIFIKNALLAKIHFQALNLFHWPYPFTQKFDLIFCRNVIVYFPLEKQQILLNALSQLLEDKGCLIIGHSESLIGLKHPLTMIKPAVYQKFVAS